MLTVLNAWRKKPAEDQSYRLPVFITVLLLTLLTVWSVWDETFSRRPWKVYQNQFFQLELAKAKEEYDAEKKIFNSAETQQKYKELQKKLKDLKEGPQDPKRREEYLEDKEKLSRLQLQLSDLARAAQFAKSRFDAAYYIYEKAIIEKSPDLEKDKQDVDAIQKELDDISAKIKQVETESQPLWKAVQAFDEEVAQTQKDFAAMTAKLEMLEKKVNDVRAKRPKIEQIVNNDLKVVDRCQTCHMGIDRKGFEDTKKYPQPFTTHPKLDILLKEHPPEKFGCTTCHGGQGPALTVKTAHGEVKHWEAPLLKGHETESSCRKCHAGTVETPEAPVLNKGRILFSSLGCSGCHLAPGYEDAWKVGPELTNIHEKTTMNWIKRWILNPRSFKPTTRMPQFKITDEEAGAMAQYLASTSHPQPATDEEKSLLAKGNPEEGKKLFNDLACIACHRIGEEGDVFAPNLSFTGSKVRPEWLIRWLKNPRDYSPHGRMPNMRMTDDEIAHVASYLLSLKKGGADGENLNPEHEDKEDPEMAKKGLQLMGNLGCHGCHVVPGLENRPRVGAELSAFGAKKLDLLFFGYAEHIPHHWKDWTQNKLKNPQVYATERIEQKMPDFHLSDEEINSLVTLLRSFRGEENAIPLQYRKILTRKEEDIEKGRRLVRHLNCTGCHAVEGQGSDIAPNLTGEGEKVQPEWLFKFLKDPISIRPWMTVRMPRFNLSDEDAGNLVSYFSATSNKPYPYEFTYFGEVKAPERERKAGEKLFEMFKCMSCHPVSVDPTQKGDQLVNLGPNLGMAKDRLRHDWIARWILEPEVIQPGTKMPTNFPKMGDKRTSFVPNLLKTPQFSVLKKDLEDLFGADLDAFLADPAWQTRAMRDHLISLGNGAKDIQASIQTILQPAAEEKAGEAQLKESENQTSSEPEKPAPPSEDGF